MLIAPPSRRRGRRWRVVVLGVGLMAAPGVAGADSGQKQASAEAVAVTAHYALSYNGLKVGRLDVVSSVDGKAYTISGTGSVSVLLGVLKWSGTSNAAGAIENGAPVPRDYGVEWHANKKTTTVRMAFKDRTASDIALEPPPKLKHDTVPLLPAHKTGALDPFSAIIPLTRADDRGPCERQVAVFDGWQRVDLAMSLKRVTRLPPQKAGGAPAIGYVCRIVYRPVAGHRDNADTKAYAANRDSEVVLRPIAGTRVLLPHSVSIPTIWGTGAMTMTHAEISSASIGKIALSE